MFESGMIDKWVNEWFTYQHLEKDSSQECKALGPVASASEVEIVDFQGALILLAMGLCIAVAVLILEFILIAVVRKCRSKSLIISSARFSTCTSHSVTTSSTLSLPETAETSVSPPQTAETTLSDLDQSYNSFGDSLQRQSSINNDDDDDDDDDAVKPYYYSTRARAKKREVQKEPNVFLYC